MLMVRFGLSASPLPDSAWPSWILTHHLPPWSPLRSNWMVAFVLPARDWSRADGMRSKTISGVTWSALRSVIYTSCLDRPVHDIGLGENLRKGARARTGRGRRRGFRAP